MMNGVRYYLRSAVYSGVMLVWSWGMRDDMGRLVPFLSAIENAPARIAEGIQGPLEAGGPDVKGLRAVQATHSTEAAMEYYLPTYLPKSLVG